MKSIPFDCRRRQLRVGLAAFCLVVFPSSVRAAQPTAQTNQTAPPATGTTTPPNSFNTALHEQEWDTVIDAATTALNATPPPSAQNNRLYHYYRGDAYLRTGLIDEAAIDFQATIDASPAQDRVADLAQNLLDNVKRQIAARPAVRRDVTIDGQVRFTIFADVDNIALQELVDLAPVAANAVKSLTGESPRHATIMLFTSEESLQAFNAAGGHPNAWTKGAFAVGGVRGVEILLTRKAGAYVCDPRSPYFRFTIAHEYTHVIVQRLLAAHPGLPTWLSEGVANAAGGHAAASELSSLAREFRLMVKKNEVESLEEISGRRFYEAAFADDAVSSAKFSYAQATSMTTYLLLGRHESVVGDLLHALRQSNDFPTAFQATFGESVEAFYTDWCDYALPKKPKDASSGTAPSI